MRGVDIIILIGSTLILKHLAALRPLERHTLAGGGWSRTPRGIHPARDFTYGSHPTRAGYLSHAHFVAPCSFSFVAL